MTSLFGQIKSLVLKKGMPLERALCFVHRGCNRQQRLKQNKAA